MIYSWKLIARAAALIPLTAVMPISAIAGGSSLGADEQQDFPSYFGFAQDSHGTFLNGVKVTLNFPHAAIVVRTDPLGAYKIPVNHTNREM
jgi:hypothetical protein